LNVAFNLYVFVTTSSVSSSVIISSSLASNLVTFPSSGWSISYSPDDVLLVAICSSLSSSSSLFTFKELSSAGSSTGTGDCLSGSVLPYTERITLKSYFSTFSTSTRVTESSSFSALLLLSLSPHADKTVPITKKAISM